MTARRAIAIGLGGAVAVIAAAIVGNLLGVIIGHELTVTREGDTLVIRIPTVGRI